MRKGANTIRDFRALGGETRVVKTEPNPTKPVGSERYIHTLESPESTRVRVQRGERYSRFSRAGARGEGRQTGTKSDETGGNLEVYTYLESP